MRVVSLALSILLLGGAVPSVAAEDGALSRGFSTRHANVSHARAWLRERVSASEFRCAHILWDRESSWNPHAHNPYSGAHGIPQALPGSKMSSAGPDWKWNATTQVRWGLHYVRGRYGGFCRALAFQSSRGWY